MCSLLGNLKKIKEFNVGHGVRKHDHFVKAVLYQSWVGRLFFLGLVIVINVHIDGNILGILALIYTLLTINIIINMYINNNNKKM